MTKETITKISKDTLHNWTHGTHAPYAAGTRMAAVIIFLTEYAVGRGNMHMTGYVIGFVLGSLFLAFHEAYTEHIEDTYGE